MQILEFLNQVSEKGVVFHIGVQNQWGSTEYFLTPEKVIQFNEDPASIYAEVHSVTREQYLQWMNEDCSVRCSETTSNGQRCKNLVPGGCNVDAVVWVERQGEYCHVHGGD